ANRVNGYASSNTAKHVLPARFGRASRCVYTPEPKCVAHNVRRSEAPVSSARRSPRRMALA
ncbi:MAG: hypothetical protein WKF77_28825, partial [Planctomycetaceae bacterium]